MELREKKLLGLYRLNVLQALMQSVNNLDGLENFGRRSMPQNSYYLASFAFITAEPHINACVVALRVRRKA